MDKGAYVYEEEPTEEGLTFKKLGHFFKVGWLRMVVYLVALCILASAVVLPVKYLYKTERTVCTSVEFIFDGIEKGLDPAGGMFYSDSIISTKVLNAAVEEAGLGDVVNDISKLRGRMRVEGMESDEYKRLVKQAASGNQAALDTLSTYVMHPTQFNIIISEPKKLGLTDTQAKQLLEKVVECYYDDFKLNYSTQKMFSADMFKRVENDDREFTKIYDSYYYKAFMPIGSHLNELKNNAKNPTLVINGTSFASLLSEYEYIDSLYSDFNNYVVRNSVWRDKAGSKVSLEKELSSLNKDIKNKTDRITDKTTQISNYKPSEVKDSLNPNGTTTTVTKYDEYYVQLQKELDALNDELYLLETQKANIEERIAVLEENATPTSSTLIAGAEARLDTIEVASVAFVGKVNDFIAAYNNATFVASAVRQTKPATVFHTSLSFNVLVVYLVVAIVAVFAACIVTGVKISKANRLSKLAEQKPASPVPSEDNK